jgi:choline-sulfatase
VRRFRPDPRRRRRAAFAFAAAVAAALACAPRESPPPKTADGWNLLLVTLDTVRADRLGAYGRAGAETPNLDALAAAGLRFDQAQAAVPLTLPSHATMLSGLLPPRHGLRDNGLGSLPADVPLLSAHLSAAGYRTGAFVGAFVLDHRYGLARGFDRYDDEVRRDPAGGGEGERPGGEVVDRALGWLAEPAAGKPFFAWVHLYDAHAPYEPPEPFRSRHAGDPYAGEIAAVDAQVGRLLRFLREHGHDRRTVIVVAADHGESLGEHGELTHGLLLYQATLRVPWLLAAPGLLAPRAVAEPVSLADLGPTVAGLLGRPLPGPLDGRDLGGVLLAGGQPAAADLYAESRYALRFGWSPLAALRRGPLKYVEAPRSELYDLAADPAEARDLRGSRRRDANELREALAALAREERQAPAAPADAESRALIESLGYVAPAGAPAAGSGRDPKDAVPLFHAFEQAHAAQLAGRLADAERLLAPLLAKDLGNPVFRGAYGRVLRDQGRLAEAVPVYRQAAALAPRDPQVWYELATALQQAGESAEARRALEHALRNDPGRPEAHNALGVALASEGRLREAREAFVRATAADPRDARAWNNLGNTERDLGDAAAAERAYRRAVELDPRYPDPLNGLGVLLVAAQRPAEGLPWLDRALALAPGRHEVRLNRGIALELMGDPAGAAEAYRDFLTHTEGNPGYSGQRSAAQELLARAAEQARGGRTRGGERRP